VADEAGCSNNEHGFTDRIPETGLRITNNRPPYPQRASLSRDAREVSGACLKPSRSDYSRKSQLEYLFDRRLPSSGTFTLGEDADQFTTAHIFNCSGAISC
jgi:hypothetical protein